MDEQAILDKYYNKVPVPVIALANELGIEVYETDSFQKHQSGSLTKEDGKFVIYVNASHPTSRKRFTIAHEIGHFINDKDYFQDKTELVDYTSTTMPLALNREEHVVDEDIKKRDTRANTFAANLLMPEKEFKKLVEQKHCIEDIAKHFQVSTSAASIRANQLLGLVYM